MPDQSLSNDAVSGKTEQEAGNPADTTANHPEEATPASLESNVTVASEGEMQQADVTINQDPEVTTGDVQTAGADDYDDEQKWPYRALQQEAKQSDVDASGKREEIVARLRAKASGGGDSSENLGAPTITTDPADPPPLGSVDPTNVENGGIQRSGRGQEHAEILQGLSNDRRKAQLAAVSERSSHSGGDED